MRQSLSLQFLSHRPSSCGLVTPCCMGLVRGGPRLHGGLTRQYMRQEARMGPCMLLRPVGAHPSKCMHMCAGVQCIRVVALGDILCVHVHADVTGSHVGARGLSVSVTICDKESVRVGDTASNGAMWEPSALDAHECCTPGCGSSRNCIGACMCARIQVMWRHMCTSHAYATWMLPVCMAIATSAECMGVTHSSVCACASHAHLHTGVHICASVGASPSRRARICVHVCV